MGIAAERENASHTLEGFPTRADEEPAGA
jgi:hypothetical protein